MHVCEALSTVVGFNYAYSRVLRGWFIQNAKSCRLQARVGFLTFLCLDAKKVSKEKSRRADHSVRPPGQLLSMCKQLCVCFYLQAALLMPLK